MCKASSEYRSRMCTILKMGRRLPRGLLHNCEGWPEDLPEARGGICVATQASFVAAGVDAGAIEHRDQLHLRALGHGKGLRVAVQIGERNQRRRRRTAVN